MNKFEQLIEYVINDESEKARELFHDIVVEKSRTIYEEMMEAEEAEEESVEEGFDMEENLMGDIDTEEQGVNMEDDEMGDEFGAEDDGFADEMGSDDGMGREVPPALRFAGFALSLTKKRWNAASARLKYETAQL